VVAKHGAKTRSPAGARKKPSPEALEAEEQLRGHLLGHRNGLRFEQVLEIEVQGPEGTFRARTIDLSRTGILFKITDPKFASKDEARDLRLYGQRVLEHFGSRILISFGSGVLRCHATVVRAATRKRGGRQEVVLGCRFYRRLSDRACRLLGIHPLRNDELGDD
jgi:hypothetical protein